MKQTLRLAADAINPALGHPRVEVMNFLNEVAMRYPRAISFAPGRPPEATFDVAAALPLVARFMEAGDLGQLHKPAEYGMDALGQYGRTNGIIGGLIARLLRQDQGIEVDAGDIVVTVGAQEGMCLCLSVLCAGKDDVALSVDPAYIGFSGAARVLGVPVAGVPAGAHGVDLDALERTVRGLQAQGRRARLLYVSADHANPTGLSLDMAMRTRLLEAAHRLDLLLVEDAAYADFCFDGEPLPALKSLPGGERVVYLGSFSKTVFPGLRLGYLAAGQSVEMQGGGTQSLAELVSRAKSLFTVNTSPLLQAVVGGLLLDNGCSLKNHVRPRVERVRRSRDAMLAALAREFHGAAGVSWNRPSGGFFLTVTLPRAVGDADLLQCARDFGVTWTPMSYFGLDASHAHQIRLSFSYVTPQEIDAGIGRLAAWYATSA